MNPEKIIAADRNFVQKLQKLRSRLDVRQKEYEKRSLTHVLQHSIVLIITLLVAAGMGYTIHRKQGKVSTVAQQQAPQSENAQMTPSPSVGPLVEPGTGIDPSDMIPHTQEGLSKNQTATAQAATLSHAPVENKIKTMAGENEHILPDGSGVSDLGVKGIDLVSVVVCGAVKDRNPLDGQRLFYPSDTSRAYVWMTVMSKEKPYVIKHIYYLNGQKYCEVPLDIKYSWMRTWSYVTLHTKKQTGEWRVEIVSDDHVLKTVGFVVRDGDTHTVIQ